MLHKYHEPECYAGIPKNPEEARRYINLEHLLVIETPYFGAYELKKEVGRRMEQPNINGNLVPEMSDKEYALRALKSTDRECEGVVETLTLQYEKAPDSLSQFSKEFIGVLEN